MVPPCIIKRVESYDENLYNGITVLLRQLYPEKDKLAPEEFQRIIEKKDIKIYVAIQGGRIIGTASLAFYEKLCGRVCVIEDVVVDSEFRDKGIGRSLTKMLIKEARSLGAPFVDVYTRRPEAREFYLKSGFQDKDRARPFFSLRYYFK